MSEQKVKRILLIIDFPVELLYNIVLNLGIVEDKPIMFDYWTASCDKEVLIGVREGGEKLLVKSEEEYTSPVSKIYKVDNEYIIITENSIYVVSADIPTKRISGN